MECLQPPRIHSEAHPQHDRIGSKASEGGREDTSESSYMPSACLQIHRRKTHMCPPPTYKAGRKVLTRNWTHWPPGSQTPNLHGYGKISLLFKPSSLWYGWPQAYNSSTSHVSTLQCCKSRNHLSNSGLSLATGTHPHSLMMLSGSPACTKVNNWSTYNHYVLHIHYSIQ